jgi:hypothetical protein
MTEPIPQAVSHSDLIIIGRLTRIDADQTAPPKYGGNPAHMQATTSYVVTVETPLKGKPASPVITVRASVPNRLYYGDPSFEVMEGRRYLFLLSNSGNGGEFIPIDRSLPMIFVSENAKATEVSEANNSTTPDPTAAILRLMLDSLADAKCRLSVMYLLRSFHDPAVISAARPFMDDPDLEMRQNALCCLAENQVIDAIPRIAEVEGISQASGKGSSRSVTELEAYETPQATPSLNALLYDTRSSSTRVNAILALAQNRLADRSSIPYLMLALQDPEPQGLVAHTAHVQLHRIIPELGPPKDQRTFLKDPRDLEIKTVERWWVDELAGKHGNAVPLIRPRSIAPSMPSTQPNPSAARGPAD